jgi:hypothetical protein
MKFEYSQIHWGTWLEPNTDSSGDGEWFWAAVIHYEGIKDNDQLESRAPAKSKVFNVVEILNDLGTDGWELVAVETRTGAFAIGKGTKQYYEAHPVERRWWLKRQAG